MDFFTNYEKHHLKVVDTLKSALYQKDNSIFDKLDFYDDEIYKEPLLFLCINNPDYNLWINSLIAGLTKPNTINDIQIPVHNKTIYIPNVGYFTFEDDNLKLVNCKLENNQFIFTSKSKKLNYIYKKIKKTDEGIEFLEFNHPLLKNMFVNEQGKIVDVIISSKEAYKEEYILNFSKALVKIKKTYPEYFNLIKKYIKKVVFYSGQPNSFASIQAHNTAFFNISHGNSEIFFLDNILHQCAHVFFNTLTLDKSELFKLPYNSDLSIFTENIDDKGFSLYDRFHGLFTQTNINLCFDKCLEENLYSGDSYLEFIAKFTSNMSRFDIAIKKFNQKTKYKKAGLEWFTLFSNTFDYINDRNKDELLKYKVSNQPYIFDFELFKKTNNL